MRLLPRLPIGLALPVFVLAQNLPGASRANGQSCTFPDTYPYPFADYNDVDPWAFYYRECTSYLSWRINRELGTTASPYQFYNTMLGGRWSNAENWSANARAIGYVVDNTPAVGAIAQWEASEAPDLGHLAYVERVNGDGSVDVSEYNYNCDHCFGTRCGIYPPRFIHIGDAGGGFNYANFVSTAGLSLMGSAAVSNGILSLTPPAAYVGGASWAVDKQSVGDGFRTNFQFRIRELGGGGADGIAFVIQNTGPNPFGDIGGGIGYGSIYFSLAVEFDTWQNGEAYDPNGNHVSVQSRGSAPNSVDHRFSLGAATNIPNLSDSAIHSVIIDYTPGTIRVYLDNPATPIIQAQVELTPLLSLDAGRAWVGLTAATGSATERHEVLNWSFSGCGGLGMSLTSVSGCPPLALGPGGPLAGTVAGNWWNAEGHAGAPLRLVCGFRNAAGDWVGPQPRVVGAAGAPGACVPGESFGTRSWSMNAPVAEGTYSLWLLVSQADTDAAAIADFKGHRRTAPTKREHLLCSGVRVDPRVDLFVDRVEVTQAIQNFENPVAYIGGRPTLARVYVGWNGQQDAVAGVDAILHVFSNGGPVQGSPFGSNGAIRAIRSPDPLREGDTLNFVFSTPSSYDVDLIVELNPLVGSYRVPENNYDNNIWPENWGQTNLNFECRKTPSVAYLPIDYRPAAAGSGPNLPDAALIAPGRGDAMVRAGFPIPGLNYYRLPPATWRLDVNSPGQATFYLLGLELQRLLQFPNVPDYLFAWLPGDPYHCGGGACDGRGIGSPGNVAFGGTAPDRYQRVFAHEVAHCLGLHHPGGPPPTGDADLGAYGVDVNNAMGQGRIRNRSTNNGMMVPGLDTNQTWMDLSSYYHLLDTGRLACPGSRGGGSVAEVLVIGGIFDSVSLTASIEQTYPVSPQPLTPQDDYGALLLRAYDGSDPPALLHEVRFNPVAIDCEEAPECPAPFIVLIPASTGDPPQVATRIEIVLAETGQLLVERTRSNAAPQIAFVTPETGQSLTDGMDITWTGFDDDGDSLRYVLSYSWDYGQSFLPLATDTADTSFALDASAVPGSIFGAAVLRLTATDGLNTTTIDIADLTLDAAKPPIVYIESPAAAETFLSGAAVPLSASVSDPEDGSLPEWRIGWSSDRDGDLGYGPALVATSLSVGTHELTVSATDFDDMTGSDTVRIEVVERPVGTVAGDLNYDGAVDSADQELFVTCYTGSGSEIGSGCELADLDVDGDADCDDWALFQAAFIVSSGFTPTPSIETFISVLIGANSGEAERCLSDMTRDGRWDGQDVPLLITALLGG